MGQCYQCGGYSEYGLCPDCKRNEELVNEQRNIAYGVAEEEERAKERLQHDAHIKDVLRKLLDLAVESLENSDLAEKKVKVIMKSAVFANNERDFFPEIKANSFLADCYYTLHLGSNPNTEKLSQLSGNAQNFLESWASSHHNAKYASKVKKVYSVYLSEKAEQDRIDAEERAKQQSIWEKENAQREAESKKKRLAAEARENSKKRSQTLVAVCGSAFCSLLFLGGFIAGGLVKTPLWNQEKNFTAIGSFYVLLLFCVFRAFLSSKDYILDIIRKNYPSDTMKLWLLWTGMILLFIGTCVLWKESTGIVRIILIAATIGLPLIPYIRGIIGSVALGIVAGLVSLPISYVAGATISFAYSFIFKQ